jgi:biotin synthase-like enzyme
MPNNSKTQQGIDYYIEGKRIIFTALAHIKRGQCCGNMCRHCPFSPKHTKGKVVLAEKYIKFKQS